MRKKQWMVLLVVSMLAVFAGTGQSAVVFDPMWATSATSGNVTNVSNLVGAPDGSYARFNSTDSANVYFSSYFGDGAFPFLDAGVVIEVKLADIVLLNNLSLSAHRVGTTVYDSLTGYGLYEIGSLFGSGIEYDYLRLSYSGPASPFLDIDAVAVGYKIASNGATPVPEPGTMMLLGSGLVALAGWGRKKFRS